MTGTNEPARHDGRAWQWSVVIIAVVAVAVAWVLTHHGTTGPDATPTAYGTVSSEVLLAPGLSTRTDADVTDRKVTITFDIKNIGHVPVNIAKIDAASRPGMQLTSVRLGTAHLAPGTSVTVAVAYTVTDCGKAMSITATAPIPVIVNVDSGTVTRMIEPTTEAPNEPWELFAAKQICDGPKLTQSD